MDWIVFPKIHAEALTPNQMVCGDRAFERYLGLDEGGVPIIEFASL